MNVQRLIEKYKELWNEHSPFYEPVPYTSMVELFLKELKQLDEPEKVVVPQFVADWIEHAKFEDYHLLGAMDAIAISGRKKLYEWFREDDNMELFARAWLDGYEVEEEKRYFVKITAAEQYLVKVEDENFLGFLQSRLRSKFTRKQLEEAGFGWVFDCEGIEIEEV
ncbi:DUF1642 domain-containing protein [Streptococcus oralis]|uniref:DUF1642 domain-containing protein n=1 Tax=Streptococcus oralis TaxID=1303 RepID=UPI0039C32F99